MQETGPPGGMGEVAGEIVVEAVLI